MDEQTGNTQMLLAQVPQSWPAFLRPRPWDSPGKNTARCPSPGDLRHPGIELVSSASPALATRFFTAETPGKPNR